MTQIQTFKKDNLLVDFLFQHKGKDNVVSAKEICDYLTEKGYPSRPDSINVAVRRVMIDRHLPICSVNAKGYFWATTKEELQMTIDDLQSRINEMTNRIEHLQSFIIN